VDRPLILARRQQRKTMLMVTKVKRKKERFHEVKFENLRLEKKKNIFKKESTVGTCAF
jgi:hypothetical protein